jgi:hypothetical protein
VWEGPGASGLGGLGAKMGSDGSRKRGRWVKGQRRGTAWRVMLHASPVTIPSETAGNRFFLARVLEASIIPGRS